MKMEDLWPIHAHFTEWIKHAETKLNIILTLSVGAIAAETSLYSAKVKSFHWQHWENDAIIFSIASGLVALLVAAYGVAPRTKKSEGDTGANIFYYGDSQRSSFDNLLRNSNEDTKKEMLILQIEALGSVAAKKFSLAKVATYLFCLSVLCAATTSWFLIS